MDKKKPIKVFKAGGVRAAIWENTNQKDGKIIVQHSTQIDRTYKQDGEFKRTSQYNSLTDIIKLRIVTDKVLEFLVLDANRQDDHKSE